MGGGQQWSFLGMGSEGVPGPQSKLRPRVLHGHRQRVWASRPTFTKVLRPQPWHFPLLRW